MSLKIGNVLKAIDEGKWIKVPATSGAFRLRIKQLLPGEQYAYRKRAKDNPDIDNVNELLKMISEHITGFRDLLDADGVEIPDSPAMLKNENFIHAVLSLSVTEPKGQKVLFWLSDIMGKSDKFTEDDTDFLAST